MSTSANYRDVLDWSHDAIIEHAFGEHSLNVALDQLAERGDDPPPRGGRGRLSTEGS